MFPAPHEKRTLPLVTLMALLLMLAPATPWSAAAVSSASVQDEEKEKKQDEDESEGADDEEKKEPEVPSKFTADEKKAILDLFEATKEQFVKGDVVRLEYEFEQQDDVILDDWKPAMDQVKNMRWSTDHDDEEGLMLSATGTFLHKARWQGELKVRVKATCYSQLDKPGDYFAACILDEKGKKAMGSNMGDQLIQLTGTRITGVQPKKFPVGKAYDPFDFGFQVADGKLSVAKKDRIRKISQETKKLDDVHVGLRWKGRSQVKVNLLSIVMEGTLSDEWLLEKL